MGNPFSAPTERSDPLTEKRETPTLPRKPDGIITTHRNGQTIVAELFFNHSSTETMCIKFFTFRNAHTVIFATGMASFPDSLRIHIKISLRFIGKFYCKISRIN